MTGTPGYHITHFVITPHHILIMSSHHLNWFSEKNVNIPTSLRQSTNIEPVYNHESYYAVLKFRIQKSANKAKEMLDKNKIIRIQNQAKQINPVDLKVHDKIWLKLENRRKLDPVYSGPFIVTSINHPHCKIKIKLQENRKLYIKIE